MTTADSPAPRLANRSTEVGVASAPRPHNRAGNDQVAGSALARYALTVVSIAHGRYAEALQHALTVFHSEPAELGTQILPDLTEAAVRAGNEEVAATARSLLADRTGAGVIRLPNALAARSRALLTDDAEDLYREAIEQSESSDTGLDLARAHLLYGEWLRRHRRRREAREHLRTAHELFEEMGFGAFAHRAWVELRATAESARKRTNDSGDDLTSQEAEIARLVADGSSNRQVAARLFISENTVEYHLHKVFRKIGVRTRTQLTRVIADKARSVATPAPAVVQSSVS